jgi:hypothetical protein
MTIIFCKWYFTPLILNQQILLLGQTRQRQSASPVGRLVTIGACSPMGWNAYGTSLSQTLLGSKKKCKPSLGCEIRWLWEGKWLKLHDYDTFLNFQKCTASHQDIAWQPLTPMWWVSGQRGQISFSSRQLRSAGSTVWVSSLKNQMSECTAKEPHSLYLMISMGIVSLWASTHVWNNHELQLHPIQSGSKRHFLAMGHLEFVTLLYHIVWLSGGTCKTSLPGHVFWFPQCSDAQIFAEESLGK